MAQFEQTHWIAASNIARFEKQLERETDIGRRKLLEALIVLEKQKLTTIRPGGGSESK